MRGRHAAPPPSRGRGVGHDPEADAEERRLLFVGMTRATTRLVLTSSARRPPSPYLADIDPALLERHESTGRPRAEARQLKLL